MTDIIRFAVISEIDLPKEALMPDIFSDIKSFVDAFENEGYKQYKV